MRIIDYDVKKYPFKEAICKILDIEDIRKVHKVYYDEGFKEENYMKGLSESLQNTCFHKKFYSNVHEFLPIYTLFIRDVIAKLYSENIIYQKIPTFRVQAVNSVSVGGKDNTLKSRNKGIVGLHRDGDYNHHLKEVNFFLPFCDVNERNTIWAESEPGKEDYSPFLLKYGQVKVWRGVELMHGNVVNNSKDSRISVDFRIILESQFECQDKKTLTQKIPFDIGGYWERI